MASRDGARRRGLWGRLHIRIREVGSLGPEIRGLRGGIYRNRERRHGGTGLGFIGRCGLLPLAAAADLVEQTADLVEIGARDVHARTAEGTNIVTIVPGVVTYWISSRSASVQRVDGMGLCVERAKIVSTRRLSFANGVVVVAIRLLWFGWEEPAGVLVGKILIPRRLSMFGRNRHRPGGLVGIAQGSVTPSRTADRNFPESHD
jgi:hypothetical protein